MSFKTQSAFSLIEVMIALVLLSLSALGVSKLITQSMMTCQESDLREKGVLFAFGIAKTLSEEGAERRSPLEWQSKLSEICLGCQLSVVQEVTPEKCIVILTIRFAFSHLKPVEVRIVQGPACLNFL